MKMHAGAALSLMIEAPTPTSFSGIETTFHPLRFDGENRRVQRLHRKAAASIFCAYRQRSGPKPGINQGGVLPGAL
jgi:hypothetical protein